MMPINSSTSSFVKASTPSLLNQDNFTYEYYTSYDYNASNVTYEYDIDEDITLSFAYQLGDFLTHYYTPTLVFFGSIGNILSVIVFFKTKLRKLSSSYYLAALGISDTCFLLGAFVSWLNYLNINIYNRNYYCQFFTYISGLCSFLSVWFVVAFTVERFIAVLYPLKRQTMCTVKRACMVLTGLIIVGCIVCIPYFVYAAPQYSEYLNDFICDVREEYKFQMKVFNYFDTVIVFAIPLTTIIILNTFTALAVWKVASVRRTMTISKRKPSVRDPQIPVMRANYSQPPKFDLHVNSKTSKKSANTSQIKVTKMLLLVSSVFVCLNLPSYIMRIKAFLIENDEKSSQMTVITQYISWALFTTNFGINFALYCLSGQNFRKAVIGMFKLFKTRFGRPPEKGATQVTVSEFLRNSNSTASTKRRIVANSDYDIQELQCVNANNGFLAGKINENGKSNKIKFKGAVIINSTERLLEMNTKIN